MSRRPGAAGEARAAIVVTNHDYDRYVGAAIDSALAQRVPCQVIAVDDGSTDRSADVLVSYGDRVEVIAKANGGQASAINAGFERCRAPVVVFLDGDDVLDPDAVATVLTALDAEPTAARCHFGLRLVDGDGQPLPGGLPEPGRDLPRGDLTDRLSRHPDDIAWQPTSGNAFRAGVLAELLPMPTEPYRISADHYLSNLSALHGPVVAVDRPLGSYRVHGANADHRPGFDLDRARSILTRTTTTRSLLIEHGQRLGVVMPAAAEGFRSLTQDALRLASYRSRPRDGHPFPDDRLGSLLGRAWRSALGRTDLPMARRALAVGWLAAVAVVPPSRIGPLVGRGLTR